MEETKIKNILTEKKIGLVQNTLNPNIYGGIFKKGFDNQITAYVDFHALSAHKHQVNKKIAILVEPRTVHRELYEWFERNYSMFDMVLTHDKKLCSFSENIKYYPVWPIVKIKEEDRQIYKKTKSVSAIFSNRNMTEGHKFRHVVAKEFHNKIDLYGTGYKKIQDKITGTSDYRYQIVIENIKEGYVSEKANDCFVCGTVPIYWGGKKSNIVDFYDEKGVIFFENISELKNILSNVVSKEDYEKRRDSIKFNFIKAKNLSLDGIYYEYGLKDFLI